MKKVYITAGVIIALALFGFAFAVLSGGEPVGQRDGQPWEVLTAEQLQQAIDRHEPLFLVDLRQPEDYREGHIPGAVNIPFETIETAYTQIPKDSKVVVIAGSDASLADASSQWLMQNGYEQVAVLAGGMAQWHGEIEH